MRLSKFQGVDPIKRAKLEIEKLQERRKTKVVEDRSEEKVINALSRLVITIGFIGVLWIALWKILD